MKNIRNFFWLCSGAHIKLLEQSPSESSKYVGIGATVFFTGVFASIAGFYAFNFVFDKIWVAVLMGIVWGLMLFNLDRYIVSSMRKKGGFKKELILASPRIILAILIAMVISKPLELKVFEKEIAPELIEMEQEQIAERETMVKNRFDSERERLNQDILQLQAAIESKSAKRDELVRIAQQEADGTGGTMRRNAGPIYRIKKVDADRVQRELNSLTAMNNATIRNERQDIASLDEGQAAAIAVMIVTPMDGLAARLDALSRISRNSSAIMLVNWFIILLFIAIESAPVLVKLLSPRGPYDDLLQTIEYRSGAEGLKDMALVNENIKKRAEQFPDFEKEYIVDQLEAGLSRTGR